MATSFVTNPMYILHLTDFHLGNHKINEIFSEEIQDNLIFRIREFLESRGRKHLDILCITGDMMDKNGGSKTDFDSAIIFVDKLKKQIPEITQIYCVPGNHDINCDKSLAIPELLSKRQSIIPDPDLPNYKIVDDSYLQIVECFEKYKNFVDTIGANQIDKNCLDPDNLRHFIGFNKMQLPFNKNIFISWFNTSWLCLQEEQWKHVLKNPEDKIVSRTKYFYDHDKISPGHKINESIYNSFNGLKTYSNTDNEDDVETLFTLSMCHHFPRLLSWHDQYDYKLSSSEGGKPSSSHDHKSFYSHLSQYSLVLNGHTHGQLFDAPYATNSYLDYTSVPASLMIYEVNFLSNFIVHYKIPIVVSDTKNPFSLDKITTFNEQKFLAQLKSLYCYKDLVRDLEWHESCFGIENYPGLDPIERVNYLIERSQVIT